MKDGSSFMAKDDTQQNLKYVSEKRVQEILRLAEPFQKTEESIYSKYSNFPNGPYLDNGSHEINRPFKKLSVLKYEGVKFITTSSS